MEIFHEQQCSAKQYTHEDGSIQLNIGRASASPPLPRAKSPPSSHPYSAPSSASRSSSGSFITSFTASTKRTTPRKTSGSGTVKLVKGTFGGRAQGSQANLLGVLQHFASSILANRPHPLRTPSTPAATPPTSSTNRDHATHYPPQR
ncbi:hypothetical protein A0H81_09419 [Grifola frondosa]|uniref:Uncharacterized protein n=1 Tax=Grifola frondosa TaxID=5627 RepID=A0A1C7M150_GRIFR|nr:hypothetical protein A0H81_09419 [Grifola frondosa]